MATSTTESPNKRSPPDSIYTPIDKTSSPLDAADYTGRVVGVLDGDTIKVLHNQRPERIRLSGIDCPEKGQAYGNKAKQATSALVFGKEVTLQTHGKDRYGRTIGCTVS